MKALAGKHLTPPARHLLHQFHLWHLIHSDIALAYPHTNPHTFMRLTPLTPFGRLAAMPPAAGEGQRVGLLGGSFNPPHAAHALISDIALKRLHLDRLWWLVTPGNPLKSADELMPLNSRIAACRAMVTNPRIQITAFEQHLPSRYTSATLDFLRQRQPTTQFVWVMGADCLAHFHRWHRWQHIFATMPVAVVNRPGWLLPAVASPAARRFQRNRLPEAQAASLAANRAPAWTLLTGPLSPLSSTRLRGERHNQPTSQVN